MTWTRLSDEFNDRPELLLLSRSARLLHVEALVYSNRLLTDGQIPRAALTRFSDTLNPETEIRELIDAGLWEAEPGKNGWQIRNWSEPPGRGEAQERKSIVLARQEANREKQERFRERERLHCSGDHSKCPRTRPCRTVTGYETGNGTGSVTRSQPNPARPDPKESGSGPRCTHGRRLAIDGTGCAICAESPAVIVDVGSAPVGRDEAVGS